MKNTFKNRKAKIDPDLLFPIILILIVLTTMVAAGFLNKGGKTVAESAYNTNANQGRISDGMQQLKLTPQEIEQLFGKELEVVGVVKYIEADLPYYEVDKYPLVGKFKFEEYKDKKVKVKGRIFTGQNVFRKPFLIVSSIEVLN